MAKKVTISSVFKDGISKPSAKAAKNLQKNFKGASTSAGGLSASMSLLSGAAGGLAAVIGTKLLSALSKLPDAFIGASAEVETLSVQFETLLGSAELAQNRIEGLVDFAAHTPFQLPEISKASRVLQTLTQGVLASSDGLRLVGDAAAASGADFENLAMHVGRAYDGLNANRPVGESMMRLQELGIVSGDTRNEIEKLQKAGKGKEAWEALKEQLKKSQGAMEKLSKTAKGLSSTIRDQLAQSMRDITSEGLFEDFKDGLRLIKDTFDMILDSGVLKEFGTALHGSLKILLMPSAADDIEWNAERISDTIINFTRKTGVVMVTLSAEIKKAWIGISTAFSAGGSALALYVAFWVDIVTWGKDRIIEVLKDTKNEVLKRFEQISIAYEGMLDAMDKPGIRQKISGIRDVIAGMFDFEKSKNKKELPKPEFPTFGISKEILKELHEELLSAGADLESIEKAKQEFLNILAQAESLGKFRKKKRTTEPEPEPEPLGGKPETTEKVASATDAWALANEKIIAQYDKLLDQYSEELAFIEKRISAQRRLRDIAIASITDQFDAARAESKAQYEDELFDLAEMLNNKLITYAEYEEARANLAMQYAETQKEIADNETQYKLGKLNEYTSTVQSALSTITGALRDYYSYQKELISDETEAQKDVVKTTIKSKKLQAKELAKIDEEAEKKRKEIRKEELYMQLIMAIANTAQAVTKALADSPPAVSFVMAALAGAAGAVQIGIITSQISKLAKGGIIDGKGNKDSEPAMLTPGEMVINKQQQARLFAMANGQYRPFNPEPANITFSDQIIVYGNLDENAANQIRVDREKQLYDLRDMLQELSYRGQIEGVTAF